MPTLRDSARTRGRILDVARSAFTQRGYERTTVREIAAQAGVAANLVTRYFGGKEQLWREACALDLEVGASLEGPLDELGARLARRIVTRWCGLSADDPLTMLIRSAGSSENAAAALGTFFDDQVAPPLMAHLGSELGLSPQESADRIAAINALVMGVAMARLVVGHGPLGAASPAALESWLGAQLQAIVDGRPPTLGALGTWARAGVVPEGS